MSARAQALEAALRELTAMVRGECPSLLNEDSGGCARLSIEIDALLAAPPVGVSPQPPDILAVLRDLEWIGMNDGRGVTRIMCPACSALKSRGSGHNPYCGLAAVLAATKAGGVSPQPDDWKADMGEGWFVTVGRFGASFVTLEETHMGGKPYFTPEDRALVRGAALHLLAFIGHPASLSPVEPTPPVHNDLCSWCLTQADHVAASYECYERNSERNRIAPTAPVEPTPPAEDEDDDEVPVACAEGAPDAWSAPLRKPVVPKILSTDDFYALLRILEVLPADPFLSALQSKLSDEERRQHGNQASRLSGPEFVREIERVEALIQSRVQLPALPVEPTPEPPPDAQVCVWREIETAPKDGTEVLLLGPDGSIDFGHWRADRKYAAGGVWRMRQWLYVFPDAVAWSPIPPRWAPAPQGGEQ